MLALAGGCKMDNPAFELYGDGAATGSGDDDGYDDGATDDDTGGGGGACWLDFEGLRLVRYLIPSNVQCQELVDLWLVAVEVTPDGLVLEGPCTPGCEECEDRGAVLLGAGDDQTGSVPVCLHVHNERPYPPEAPEFCNFGALTIWPEDESHPLVVGSAAGYGIPGDAAQFLDGLVIETETLEECACIEAEGCCNPARPPQQHKLLINDTPVYEGESVTAIIQGYEYLFTNVQSHSTGICPEPPHIGWGLTVTG